MSSFLSSVFILEISPLSDGLAKIFSNSIGCHFALFTKYFPLQKFLSFRRSNLLIVVLSVCATDVIFKKLSPVPIHSGAFPILFSMKFNVIRLILRFLNHLHLSFAYGNRLWINLLFSTYEHPVIPVPFVGDAFFFSSV